MKRETLDRLVELVNTASEPQFFSVGDPRVMASVVNGEVVERVTAPPPRQHKVGALGQLISLANRFGEDAKANPDDHPDVSPVVWYDREAVTLVIDDAGHRLETATLSLEFSAVFDTVLKLRETQAWLEHKPFVRLLRIDLAGTLDPVHLLNAVRSVKFESGQVSRGEVMRGRESLGREIVSKVEPAAELPEEVTLMVPVFKTAGLRQAHPIRCAVDVDPPSGRFQLLPLPDEVDIAIASAVEVIGDFLDEGLIESVRHYQGRP